MLFIQYFLREYLINKTSTFLSATLYLKSISRVPVGSFSMICMKKLDYIQRRRVQKPSRVRCLKWIIVAQIWREVFLLAHSMSNIRILYSL